MKLKFYYVLGIFLLGILFFSLRIGTTVAEDDDNDTIEDDMEDLNMRSIEIEWGTNEFEIESTLRTGTIKNEIDFEVEYNSNGLSIENEYERESGTEEYELEFKVIFYKLIEYIDNDGDNMYNSSIDGTIQEVALNSFQDIIYTTLPISSESLLHYIIINTTDGIFTAHIYVVEEFASVNNNILTPFEAKIDIEITNFNYFSGSSQLALYTKLVSEAEYEEEEETEDELKGYSNNEKAFTAIANDTTGFFSWAKKAQIDGLETDILVSNKDIDDLNPNDEKLYINYQRGDHIYHDPKIGLAGLAQTPSSSSDDDNDLKDTFPLFETIIIVSIIATVAIIGVIYLKHKK